MQHMDKACLDHYSSIFVIYQVDKILLGFVSCENDPLVHPGQLDEDPRIHCQLLVTDRGNLLSRTTSVVQVKENLEEEEINK